jgi:hypothetical protein
MSKKPSSSAKSRKPGSDEVVGEVELATSGDTKTPTPDMGKADAEGLPIEHPEELPGASAHGKRLQALFKVAQTYGDYSFDNYARIRSLAETLRDEFCAWLSEEPGCVFLVPPEGRFSAKNYQSAAFSVAGKGYLPLQPISFGLAVRVSEDKDFMRVNVICRKEGDTMFVRLEKGAEIKVPYPKDEEALSSATLEPLFTAIYEHLTDFFQKRIDDYENGRYGTQEIGFDIQRMTS